MHDMDRTTLETNGFDYEEAFEMDDVMEAEYDEEYDDEYDDEFDDEYDDEYDDEMDDEMDDEYDDEMDDEYDDELDDEMGGAAFSEEEEAELAFELLSVQSQEEMDEFLGKLIKRVGRKFKKGFKRFTRNPFRFIKKGLRKVARFALPVAGRVAGSFFGGPLGGRIGRKFGRMASRFFEIELEGMSPEDQEFEIARRFVRFSGAATRHAMRNAARMNPARAARVGFKQAARRHAPGMLKPARRRGRRGGMRQHRGSKGYGGHSATGRWIRKGDRVMLLGVR